MPMNEEEIKALKEQIIIYKEQLKSYELTRPNVDAERVNLLLAKAERDLAEAQSKPAAMVIEPVKKQQEPDMEQPVNELANRFKAEQQPAEIKSSALAEAPLVAPAQEEDSVKEMLAAVKGAKAAAGKLMVKAEAQANAIMSKLAESGKLAREHTPGYQNNVNSLIGYRDHLQSTELHEKKWIFRSNKVEKLNIVNNVIEKMNTIDPADLTQLNQLKQDVEGAIKANMKATGAKLWNRGGDLNKELNKTLKMIDENIKVLKHISKPPSP